MQISTWRIIEIILVVLLIDTLFKSRLKGGVLLTFKAAYIATIKVLTNRIGIYISVCVICSLTGYCMKSGYIYSMFSLVLILMAYLIGLYLCMYICAFIGAIVVLIERW
jgi:hypothetical protein